MKKNRRGFTLIELLIVVVVIGLLAAIVVPKFGSSREKAFLASMKSDLRNLVALEESYHATYVTYTSSLAALQANPSRGVVITIANVDALGWSATASHSATNKSCAVFIGSAPVTPPAEETGEVLCD